MRRERPTRFCLFAFALAALVGGCAPLAAPPLTITSASPPPDFASAIGVARAARDRATMLHAPAPGDLASASDEAIADVLRRWAAARRDATQDAHRLYTEALHAAAEPAEEATAYAEIADLWLRMEEDTRSALFAATPAEYRDDPSLVSAVQGATVYALRPILDRVESHLGACGRVAHEAAGSTPGTDAATACARVAARLDAASDPRGPARADPIALTAAAPPAEPERPVLPTTHPKPCTFQGTLAARGTIYASEAGTSVVLVLDPARPIELDSLAVPAAAGGRYKVTVRWPSAAEGYLETDDGPFVVMRAVDLPADGSEASEPRAAWAEAGDRVGASEARGPTVRVAHPHDGATPSSERALPAERRLFCHDLALATSSRSR